MRGLLLRSAFDTECRGHGELCRGIPVTDPKAIEATCPTSQRFAVSLHLPKVFSEVSATAWRK